jgi:hypothetical protein
MRTASWFLSLAIAFIAVQPTAQAQRPKLPLPKLPPRYRTGPRYFPWPVANRWLEESSRPRPYEGLGEPPGGHPSFSSSSWASVIISIILMGLACYVVLKGRPRPREHGRGELHGDGWPAG